jgi:hypothetical protein
VTFDDPHVVAKAADFASSVLQRLGLQNSSFHLEAFLTSGGDFVFLEVACRFGGAGVPRQLRLVYGFDIVEESLLACMQLPSRWRGAGTVLGTPSVGASGWLYMPVPGETRSRVRGVHGLDARPDSVIFAEIPNVGEVLDPAGFYIASGKFVLSGAGTESVERDLRRIMDTYAVDVEPLPHAA